MFLYFGHEIPEVDDRHYDESVQDSTPTVKKYSNALHSFTGDQRGTNSKYFDLLVMSTCYNGSPQSISTLAPYTRYIIASPTNLHLSYFDLEPFEHLEGKLVSSFMSTFANYAATCSYTKLSTLVQTVVGVAVYDIASVEPYLQIIEAISSQTLATATTADESSVAHCDCVELAPFKSPLMHNGVRVLYRAPLFVRESKKSYHSGWSCWTVDN